MRKYFLLVAAVMASVIFTTNANAALDVATALSGSDAKSNMEAAGTFVLGVVVGLFAISVVRRALGK